MNMCRPMQNSESFFPAQYMCEVSYEIKKLTKLANFSVLPVQRRSRAAQGRITSE